MDARAVEDATTHLQELRQEEWQDLGLAVLALGLALVATQLRPALAVPLFVGGAVLGARGVVALWRRWDLVDRLAAEQDAHAIAEVRAYASRQATMERRQWFAATIRGTLAQHESGVGGQISKAAEELAALACELEDSALDLDPACAMACARLVSDPAQSPLLDPALSEELRSRIRQIRSGFTAVNRG